MTTNDNDRKGQPEQRRQNSPGAPADLNRMNKDHDAAKPHVQHADSKEKKDALDNLGGPTDDRPEGQASQADKSTDKDGHERIGFRLNETGDDRISKRTTDPNRPIASSEDSDDTDEVESEHQDLDSTQARDDRKRQLGFDLENEDEGRSLDSK